MGTPLEVPDNADAKLKECLRLELETRLQELTDFADEKMGNSKLYQAMLRKQEDLKEQIERHENTCDLMSHHIPSYPSCLFVA